MLLVLIDKPYISNFLKKTIEDNNIPTVTLSNNFYRSRTELDQNRAVALVKSSQSQPIYITSENAIGWISKNLGFTDLPQKIELFKNKVKFRDRTKVLYPNFYYKPTKLSELRDLDFNSLKTPFIIKPAVGFFSMGVYRVDDLNSWNRTLDSIDREMIQIKDLYPPEVMGSEDFIIEEVIEGEEFAFDAYIDDQGNPVILSILKHLFSSGNDVSDRVYISSTQIIRGNIDGFIDFLSKICGLFNIKNFPMHVEVRIDKHGNIVPIEVNPMRFGGWCTTADLSYLAYGINPYLHYYSKLKPDWDKILKDNDGKIFSIVVLDNSTGIDGSEIESFDYTKLCTKFEKPLELRKIDFKEYPLFGFIFTETREENMDELYSILSSDLKEFIS